MSYEILRVKENPKSFENAYEYLKAYSMDNNIMDLDEFQKRAKSIYMLADNVCYHGLAVLYHSNPESDHISTDSLGLDVCLFEDRDIYLKSFELIRTIINSARDRVIVVYNVPDNNKEFANALRNNGFIRSKLPGSLLYSHIWYLPPADMTLKKRYRKLKKMSQDDLLRVIDPKNVGEVIDKFTDLDSECEKQKIQNAQDRYMKDLMERNIAASKEANHEDNSSDTCCCCGNDEDFLDSPEAICNC